MTQVSARQVGGGYFVALALALGAIPGAWLAGSLDSLRQTTPGGGMWGLAIIVGGVPIALGVGLFVWGRSLWRRTRRPPSDPR